MLRRSLRRREGSLLSAQKAARKKWKKWEDEVEGGQELAQEGDVVHWRSAQDEPWQLAARLVSFREKTSKALVLAVQVVYEPSSGPHGAALVTFPSCSEVGSTCNLWLKLRMECSKPMRMQRWIRQSIPLHTLYIPTVDVN